MEKLIKRLFLGGTLLVALAVSLTAFSTYAADNTTANGETTFKLNVKQALQISDVKGVSWEQANVGNLNEKDLTATVNTNLPYTLNVHADTPALTMTESDATIPAVDTPVGGESGWAMKSLITNAYQKVTNTPTSFYRANSTQGVLTPVALPVGIGISPTQEHGTYSTTVTLTLIAQP